MAPMPVYCNSTKNKFNRKVFHFLTLKSVRRHMVDRLGGNQPVAWCLPKYDNMNTGVCSYISTPQMGFKPTVPAFDWQIVYG